MKNRINIFILLLGLTTLANINGCKDKNVTAPPDNTTTKTITTIKIVLTDEIDPADVVNAVYKDIDGPGGNAPEIDTLMLRQGATYEGNIQLFDERYSPTVELTDTIENAANTYQYFYYPQGNLVDYITITKQNIDTNNPPISFGSRFVLAVKAVGAAEGKLQIVLSRYNIGDKTLSPSGTSEFDIVFPVKVR